MHISSQCAYNMTWSKFQFRHIILAVESFMGAMVALLYCLITDDVKNEWNRVLERRRSTNALGSYDVSCCFKLRRVFRFDA